MPRRLRLVLACDWFVKYTAGLARGYAAEGCDVLLLTRDRVGELPGEDAVRQYVRDHSGAGVEHRTLSGRVRDPRALGELRALRRDVRAFAPDVVHLQESVLDDPRLLLAAGPRRGGYGVTFHDPTPHPGDPVPGLKRRMSERALLRHAGVVFVHSEVDKAELPRHFAISAPIEVVPHGTGTPQITPLPATPTLLFFGRILAYKGLRVLLDSMARVWATIPDAQLVVAGAGDLPVHAALEDPRVTVRHEHVPESDVPALFEAARCVVLPYEQASQSGVGSQAKVYGRPMVVTAAGGLPELVADGSGLVVEPGDPVGLAEALLRVLLPDGPGAELARCAGVGGRESDWPAVARRSLAAFELHLPQLNR